MCKGRASLIDSQGTRWLALINFDGVMVLQYFFFVLALYETFQRINWHKPTPSKEL